MVFTMSSLCQLPLNYQNGPPLSHGRRSLPPRLGRQPEGRFEPELNTYFWARWPQDTIAHFDDMNRRRSDTTEGAGALPARRSSDVNCLSRRPAATESQGAFDLDSNRSANAVTLRFFEINRSTLALVTSRFAPAMIARTLSEDCPKNEGHGKGTHDLHFSGSLFSFRPRPKGRALHLLPKRIRANPSTPRNPRSIFHHDLELTCRRKILDNITPP
jgi:hypothetical protein